MEKWHAFKYQKVTFIRRKILSKIEIINELRKHDFKLDDFFESFKDVSAVWKIFLLHIINPDRYPIYDQHIHRAFRYLNNLDYRNIDHKSISDKNKIEFYTGEYLPFIESVIQPHKNIDIKKIDEALFTFGKFIKDFSEKIPQ